MSRTGSFDDEIACALRDLVRMLTFSATSDHDY